MHPRSTSVALELFDATLNRMLAFGEIVQSIDYTLSTMMSGPQSVGLFGILHISLKGPVIGQPISNFDVHDPNPVLAGDQSTIDLLVRNSLESIRAQRARILSGTNGHTASV